MNNLLEIPSQFMTIHYEPSRIPGANQGDLNLGANCQVFAYALLSYFNKKAPQLRSSELWDDKVYTKEVDNLEQLDLMLYNKKSESYGAHVGVYIGNDKVIHLSQRIGKPQIISHQTLQLRNEYKYFIGAKRVL